jgi:hypothetical protein
VDHTLVFLTIMLLYYKSGLKQVSERKRASFEEDENASH